MRICKDCGIEKPLEAFYKTGKWYRNRCKKCHEFKFRPPTGKPNLGAFLKGHVPWNKYKVDGRSSLKTKEWTKKVFERDNHKCKQCFSTYRLHAHHIKFWKEHPELRLDLDNGITLCNSCHSKLHREIDGFPKSEIPWNKGMKLSDKHKIHLSEAHIGNVSGMIGKKHTEETKEKISKSKKGTLLSEKHREKLRGRIAWNKGLKKVSK
jgi:hypothetical protein